MKAGDLVRLNPRFRHGRTSPRMRKTGIVIKIKRELRGVNGAAMVYWSSGKIGPWLFEDLEIINESR